MTLQLLIGETIFDCEVHELQKTCPIAFAVQQADRLPVSSELPPGQNLKKTRPALRNVRKR